MSQDHPTLGIARRWPTESPFFQSLCADPQTGPIPDQNFQTIALCIAEQEQMPAQGITQQSISD